MHGDAHQLIAHFHRDLVVGNKNKLHGARHFFHHVGVTLHIGIIERRINLIQQTERCGIQVEDREYQGDRRQRLFPTRQQVDAGITLAGRPRHDADTRIQQILTGHLKVGMTATEEFREQLLELVVDLVEGLLEAGAGFDVDLANRVFQGFEGLFEVFVLGVEVFLTL